MKFEYVVTFEPRRPLSFIAQEQMALTLSERLSYFISTLDFDGRVQVQSLEHSLQQSSKTKGATE